jgi:Family of unknown function (DUF6029)
MKRILFPFLLFFIQQSIQAQGVLSGNLKANVNFFQRDSNIKADDNPLYDNLLSGGEGWLNLTYSSKGFVGNIRFDGFNNSNLQTPTSSLTGAGIGMFSLSKEFQNLTITAGHIYDQIGSGIIFRAYEDRGLLIDQALFGLHLKYVVNSHMRLKAFTGQTKNLFTRYNPILKGAVAEGDFDFNKGTLHITPGIGITNRTMDEQSMSSIVSNINTLPEEQRFVPTYNNYAMSVYNTLNWKDYTWYIEGATKSAEAINNGVSLVNRTGYAGFTSIGIAKAKFGISASAKFSNHFVMRTSPNETLLKGLYNWQPIIANIRTQRLIARYTPPSQDLSEYGGTIGSFITPNDNLTINLSYTYIDRLDNEKLFREYWADAEYHKGEKWVFHVGAQYMFYNQSLYQQKNKEEYPDILALTPFLEVVYKINQKKSVRTELQYMNTKQDYGSWAFALLEFNIAPKWSFAITDMYNITPNKTHVKEAHHYPNIFIAHSKGPHRITAQYVKQVDGINCTGGVCRYEPAFSGFKLGITTTF